MKKVVFFKPGTILVHVPSLNEIVISNEDLKRSWLVESFPDKLWYVNYGTGTNRYQCEIIDGKNAFTELKLPKLTKELRSKFTKGSVWELYRDWTLNNCYANSGDIHTLPAGTQIEVISNKFTNDGCIVAELTDELGMFKQYNFKPGEYIAAISVPEFSLYAKQIIEGATKTYWKIEDDNGNALVGKRFLNLTGVKASIRVRANLVKSDSDDIPYWIDGGNKLDYDIRTSNGLNAVHYDYTTDTEIERQDLGPYLTFSVIKYS